MKMDSRLLLVQHIEVALWSLLTNCHDPYEAVEMSGEAWCVQLAAMDDKR